MRYEQEHTPSGDETYQRTWREFGSDWRGSEPFRAALEFMGSKKRYDSVADAFRNTETVDRYQMREHG